MSPFKVRVQVKIKNISVWANHKNHLTLLKVSNTSGRTNNFPLKFSSLKPTLLNVHDTRHSKCSNHLYLTQLRRWRIQMERIQFINLSIQSSNITNNHWRSTQRLLTSMEYTTMSRTMGLIREHWLGMEWGWRSTGHRSLENSKQLSKIGQIAILALENVNVRPNMILKIHSNVGLLTHINCWAIQPSFQKAWRHSTLLKWLVSRDTIWLANTSKKTLTQSNIGQLGWHTQTITECFTGHPIWAFVDSQQTTYSEEILRRKSSRRNLLLKCHLWWRRVDLHQITCQAPI